jgi:recombination protein RecT
MFTSDKASNVWKSNFDEMALKTVLRNLLTKYGIMTVDMVPAIENDPDDPYAESEANSNTVDMDFEEAAENTIEGTATEQPQTEGEKAPAWA